MIITAIAAGLAVAWLMQGLWCLLQLQRSSPYQHQPANTSTNSSATASANLATISMLALLGSLTIAVAYSSGTRHDYTAYTNQWEIVLGGGIHGLAPITPTGLFITRWPGSTG